MNFNGLNLQQENEIDRRINQVLRPVRFKYWATCVFLSLIVAVITYALLCSVVVTQILIPIIAIEWITLQWLTLRLLQRGLTSACARLGIKSVTGPAGDASQVYIREDPTLPDNFSFSSVSSSDFSFERLEACCEREFHRRRWFGRRGS